MSELEGLHERQYGDLYAEDDVPLQSVRQRALRVALYGCVVVFIGLLVAGATLKIPRQVTVPFVLKGNNQEQVFRFTESIFAEQIFVKPGDAVKPGDKLMRISSPEIVSLINDYLIATNALAIFERNEVPLHSSEKNSLALQRSKFSSQISDAQKDMKFKKTSKESELKKLEVSLNAAEKNLEELKKLRKKGHVSEQELRTAEVRASNAEDALTRAKAQYLKDIEQIENKVRQIDVDRSITAQTLTQKDLEISSKRATLKSNVNAVYSRLKNLYGDFDIADGCIILKATTPRIVSYVFDGNRQVPAGNIALKLMTSSGNMFAQAAISPQFIGSVQRQLPAVLKVATFPHYHWGVVKGEISTLSITPDDKGNYPFEVKLTDTGKLSSVLQIGMSGECSVLVDERTVFEHLFAKFLQQWS